MLRSLVVGSRVVRAVATVNCPRINCQPALRLLSSSSSGGEPPSKPGPRGTGNEDAEGRKEPWIPEYETKFHESSEDKRQRLQYQSRKRGILENGLLLGSFCDKYLDSMTEEEMALYDRLINLPSNDWEIYYWAIGAKPTPDEFDNEVMDRLKEHAKNKDRESRITMPPLKSN